MVAMPSEANWQVTFPGNLRWSNATQIVKAWWPMAQPRPPRSIRSRDASRHARASPSSDKVWMEEWAREADRVAKVGDEADTAVNAITAGNQYMRAGNYYYSADTLRCRPARKKLAV